MCISIGGTREITKSMFEGSFWLCQGLEVTLFPPVSSYFIERCLELGSWSLYIGQRCDFTGCVFSQACCTIKIPMARVCVTPLNFFWCSLTCRFKCPQ